MKSPAKGIYNLQQLLQNMQPVLHAQAFVFVHLPGEVPPPDLEWIALLREAEGLTLVLRRTLAEEKGYPYDFVAAWITLEVHSALEGVGLSAAFSTALAEAGIPCNVMAGYYHDHLFVPYDKRDLAMEILVGLSSAS